MMFKWLFKHWLELILFLLLVFLLIPGLSFPTRVTFQRLLLSNPRIQIVVDEELQSYNWTLKDTKGTTVNFKRSQGRPVFLNIWASWCPPCMAEMPSIERLHQDYGGRLDFYIVSSEDSDRITEFQDKYEYDLPFYQADHPTPPGLKVNSLPTTYIIDSKGRILLEETGASRWDAPQVRKLLDSLSP